MPHLVLEYSNNITCTDNLNHLFDKLHHLLASELPTPLSNCKSRCIAHPVFFIGDQNKDNAFVHLTIKVISGRSDAKKSHLGKQILTILSDFFRPESKNLDINFSVEFIDLDKNYFKS